MGNDSSGDLPFVDYRWFTDKIEYLKILEEMSEESTPFDVVMLS